ncbi:MAG TPA: transposase [Candidatus Cybelea sp.]|nr:transposase [Candidatus Cybelea sp.]
MVGEVLAGPERRRRWGAEEKARIVAEAMLPSAKVTEIARRHGISRSLLYTWRREAEQGPASDGVASSLPDLVPVVIADAAPGRAAAAQERPSAAAKRTGTIEIALPDGVHVTVRGRIEERMLRVILSVLRST